MTTLQTLIADVLRRNGAPMDAGRIATQLRVSVRAVRSSLNHHPETMICKTPHPTLQTLLYRLKEWEQ